VLVANDVLCEILNVPLDSCDLMGRDCRAAAEELKELFADPDGFVAGIQERIDRRKPVYNETLSLADGRTLERDYVPYTLPDGEANLWLYRDVTDRKERERELERQNERLDEFTSVVSHDLRSPLNVVEGRLELARAECDSDHLDDAAAAVERSLSLIDGLLGLAREGDRGGESETLGLASVIEDCRRTVEADDAEVSVETDRAVRGDANRLKQLFENLLRNAVEHGGENVTVTVGELEDGFFIEDDGPGIPEAERENVFEAGYSTTEDGTGFGLSIVKRIVEAHGWEIRATEGSEGGARFEITGVEFAAE
jgi:signal transduction histidine kinase